MPELDPYTPGSGTTSLSVDHYDLSLDYRILPNRLTARAILHGQVRQDCAALSLDLVGLTVSKVAVNGRRHRFKQQNRSLILRDRSRPFVEGEEIRIDVQYAGNPAPAMGTWGDVGWEELEDGVLVAGQPTGAATWFPCNDHPSDKATFRVSILLDSDYTAISNGDLLRTVRKAGRTEWVWESLTPLATYLATMQIGQYKRGRLHHGSARPARVPIQVACEERVWDRAQKALAVQHSMLNAFEERFGPYPFSAYTVVVASEDLEIPLESQPLSILGPNHLTGEWTEERLVAHELAHQWFGNSVTPRSWADIWLNEGFACYAEWLWSEASGRDSAEAWARTYHSRLAAQPQDLVLADPGPESMFDDRVYKRGALTLHTLRRAAGDEAFFAGVRAWSKEYRHGIADTAAFLEVFSRASGIDAGAVARPWLFEKRLPALR